MKKRITLSLLGILLLLNSNPIQAEDYNPLRHIPEKFLSEPLLVAVCPDVHDSSKDYAIACDGIMCASSDSEGYDAVMRRNKGKHIQVFVESTCNRGGYQEPNPKYIM